METIRTLPKLQLNKTATATTDNNKKYLLITINIYIYLKGQRYDFFFEKKYFSQPTEHTKKRCTFAAEKIGYKIYSRKRSTRYVFNNGD